MLFLFADKYSILKRLARDKRDAVGRFFSLLTYLLRYGAGWNDLNDFCFEIKQTWKVWQPIRIHLKGSENDNTLIKNVRLWKVKEYKVIYSNQVNNCLYGCSKYRISSLSHKAASSWNFNPTKKFWQVHFQLEYIWILCMFKMSYCVDKNLSISQFALFNISYLRHSWQNSYDKTV